MASRYVVGEEGSQCLEEDVSSEPRTENVARDEAQLELHRVVFHGDLASAKAALERGASVSVQDRFGNTPLHIAVMLGHKELVECLLSRGAVVKDKNNCGWTPLDEAISYGDKNTIRLLLRNLREQTLQGLIQRRQKLISSLQNLDDFYAELKWEFHTWVPLLSRLLPSDVCRIYKSGSCIRLDSTLGDFTGMQWSRGNVSFIFNGEESRSDTLSLVVLDNDSKSYTRMKLMGAAEMEMDLNEHINVLMSKPVVYANMSTQPITVSRAQSGWFFNANKTERVGEYSTDVYNITNLTLNIRKRRENLTPEQIQEQEKMARKVANGQIEEEDLMVRDLMVVCMTGL
jgi:ankyrin repeat protein